jgi:NAD dependent epimerase/dehydratase
MHQGTIMNWKDKKVLVTGAGGFIGSHLVEALVDQGAYVTAFVHYNAQNNWGWLDDMDSPNPENINIIAGDITDFNFVKKAVEEQQIIFHLAALIGIPYSYIAPESYINTNVKGTLNIMQACREAGIERVVHTSTSEVYGTAQYTPIDEQHPLQGQSPYSASKIGADKIAESYYCSFGLPIVTIRPFNTFGPRQSTRAVIPTIITQALNSNKVNLGSLEPVRDLTFVSDTVRGFLMLAESSNVIGKIISTGTGRGISIGELAEMIIKIANPNAKIVLNENRVRPEKSEVMKLVCDNSLIQKLTGWQPKYTLEEGLKLTIEWMKDHKKCYKTGLYTV